MSKHVLITGGPSNEYIDEVMKITNMSSGKIAVQMAEEFAKSGCQVTAILTKTVRCNFDDPNIRVVRFETTEELMNAIKDESEAHEYDVVIHSAAVADYKPEFSFRMEDMAAEIAGFIDRIINHNCNEEFSDEELCEEILNILKNPKCKVNDETKISSVEPNLTVKLGLTPKIIASLREWFPDAYICGFKLLEGVTEEELVDAAMKQIKKCNTNLVFANDLAELRKGNAARLVVTPRGYDGIKVDGAYGIVNIVRIAIGDL